jgi:hypothetical protein
MAMKGWRRIGIGVFAVILASPAAQAQSLQEQGMCAEQARKAFEWDTSKWDLERKGSETRYHTMLWDYQSHYNTKLKHCFILTRRTYSTHDPDFHTINIDRYLYDAFERRVYAEYEKTSGKNKTGQDVDDEVCKLTPTYDQITYCKSVWEFDAFVAEYITQ